MFTELVLITGISIAAAGYPAPGFSCPVDPPAIVKSVFGPRRDTFTGKPAFHSGLDFGGHPGTDVKAAAAGKVTYAARKGPYGLLVIVDHDNGWESRYAHLLSIAVAEGNSVGPGDVIGRLGASGRTKQPTLHFEIRKDNKPVDPAEHLTAGCVPETAN